VNAVEMAVQMQKRRMNEKKWDKITSSHTAEINSLAVSICLLQLKQSWRKIN